MRSRQVAQFSTHGMTDNRVSDGFAHREPQARREFRARQSTQDESGTGNSGTPTLNKGEITRYPQPMSRRQHVLGRQASAALGTARGEDCPAGACAHPQSEAVGLGPATNVGLEGALHGGAPTRCAKTDGEENILCGEPTDNTHRRSNGLEPPGERPQKDGRTTCHLAG